MESSFEVSNPKLMTPLWHYLGFVSSSWTTKDVMQLFSQADQQSSFQVNWLSCEKSAKCPFESEVSTAMTESLLKCFIQPQIRLPMGVFMAM